MKRFRFIALTLMCLLAGAGVGMGIASFHNVTPVVVHAEGEETSEEPAESSEPVEEPKDNTEEEAGRIQELIDELTAKYEQIKNIQVAGTTVGAIVGALIGAVVSFIPAMMNRSNIKKSIEDLSLARNTVKNVHEELVKIQKTYDIQHEEFTNVVGTVNKLSKSLDSVNKLSKSLDSVNSLLNKALEENEKLHNENAELKDILIQIASNNSELVSKGVAEAIASKYLNK